MFSRHVEARVTELSWRRTVVVEQGRWEARRTPWKPHGDSIRNLHVVSADEPEFIYEANTARGPTTFSHEEMTGHKYFEYEELKWHTYRVFTAKGALKADVCWPEHTLEELQRVRERRESYRATFAVDDKELSAELDEVTWRSLHVGQGCQVKISGTHEIKLIT